MTLLEFVDATQGYSEANGGKPKKDQTVIGDDRLSELGIAGFDD
jgi:hypothetical protein